MKICQEKEPVLREVEPGHQVACWSEWGILSEIPAQYPWGEGGCQVLVLVDLSSGFLIPEGR